MNRTKNQGVMYTDANTPIHTKVIEFNYVEQGLHVVCECKSDEAGFTQFLLKNEIEPNCDICVSLYYNLSCDIICLYYIRRDGVRSYLLPNFIFNSNTCMTQLTYEIIIFFGTI